jgi:hypothetical protein
LPTARKHPPSVPIYAGRGKAGSYAGNATLFGTCTATVGSELASRVVLDPELRSSDGAGRPRLASEHDDSPHQKIIDTQREHYSRELRTGASRAEFA